MQRALEKLPPGLLEIFHQNIFQWKICLSIKAKLLCVKTNLSTRSQSVAGGLEIQLGNLRTVSPGGCRCRVCDLVLLQRLGWPCELLFSQRTMVMWVPWCVALSQQEKGPFCTMKDVGNPGMSAHREGQGHKAYQLQLPWGAFLNRNGGLLANHFHCLVKSQHFPREKKTKKIIENDFQPNFIQTGFEKPQGLNFC